jgi:tetratricopeptide (TPR) repeat protein
MKGLSLMRITSQKLHTSNLPANEDALRRCENALELKDKGDYEGAREAMGYFWDRVGERPQIDSLYPSVAAEVLLCVGVLTRWIGSKNQVEGAQEVAKNLITESITFYELTGDVRKVASARVELACCYWREGGLDEARITLNAALQKLTTEGNTRARALLRLAIVEWSDSRFRESLRILMDNAYLFNKITNHAVKGAYHSQLAMVLRKLAPEEQHDNYFKRAINEYAAADYQFKLAQNIVFRADVKNNVGNLFRELDRLKEAHKYIEEARRLAVRLRDKVRISQFDDTRAKVFIAEKKFKEAEAIARSAARVLEKSGHQCLLTDALITHGIALARLKQTERARFTFQKAIEVAHQVGALNKAGLAALTLIEELDDLSPPALFAAYDRASDWLSTSQSQDLLLRLNAAARKVFLALHGALNVEGATDAILNKPCDLQAEVLRFEGELIRKALAQANGSVTRAAASLEMSYQGLAYIIEARHKDLLKQRSPIRRRSPKALRSQNKEPGGVETK